MFAQAVTKASSEWGTMPYVAIGVAVFAVLVFGYFKLMRGRHHAAAPKLWPKPKMSEAFGNREEVVSAWEKIGAEADKEATYQQVLDLRRKAGEPSVGLVRGPK
jgi:hypothetical protein